MQVNFRTKEESKKIQQEEFLALSGAERIVRFLELSRAIKKVMPQKKRTSFEDRNKGNFLLIQKNLENE